jgi:hypothetical protein
VAKIGKNLDKGLGPMWLKSILGDDDDEKPKAPKRAQVNDVGTIEAVEPGATELEEGTIANLQRPTRLQTTQPRGTRKSHMMT